MTEKKPDLNKISDIIAAADADAKKKEAETTGPKIDPEFEDLLDRPSTSEFNELKKAIEVDGIREPAIVWAEENILVDGHNRTKIANLLGIPMPDPVMKSFKDRDAVKQWMLRNQLGRRNLTQARYDYYIGCLYNEMKQDPNEARTPTGGQTTAQTIAKDYNISDRTVRRLGDVAKGIDVLAKVKGKLAKATQLDGGAAPEEKLTNEELVVVGQIQNSTIAKRTIDNIQSAKKQVAATKKAQKQEAKKVAAVASVYPVVFSVPNWGGMGFSHLAEPKPPLDKEATLYMHVPDENLSDAFELIKKWGLTYEGTIAFYSNQSYEGTYAKIVHSFLLVATKGTVAGPAKAQMSSSVVLYNGDEMSKMTKLIETYHPKEKRLDMRKNNPTKGDGWENLNG